MPHDAFGMPEMKPLGLSYKGIKVTPSTKDYFYEYQYKITLKGNWCHYDIQMYQDLHAQLNKVGWWYRVIASAQNINVYVNSQDYLDSVLDWFQHTDCITGLHGPINQEHIDTLQDRNTEYVYRNKYWYNKYNIKITLSRPFGTKTEDLKASEFREFVKGSFEKYRLFDDYTDNWYSNYLWLTQEEYNKGYPFLKFSYGHLIEKIQTVKLTEI